MTIYGYTDRWTVRPGQRLGLHVHSERSGYESAVVRLHGPIHENECAETEQLPGTVARHTDGARRRTGTGSFASLPLPRDWLRGQGFTVTLRFEPTTPVLGREQVLLYTGDTAGRTLLALVIGADGMLGARLGGAEIACAPELAAHRWYEGTLGLDGGRLELRLHAVHGQSAESTVSVACTAPEADVRWTTLAAAPCAAEPSLPEYGFNGKIENPVFWNGLPGKGELIAAYEFGRDFESTTLHDGSAAGRHGILHQSPQRAVTGSRWDGTTSDFRTDPGHYAAVHFHDDDLEDAGWPEDRSWTVPELSPGVYGFRLDNGADVDIVPFFVRDGRRECPVLFLAPTFTYLAYANEHLYTAGGNLQFMAQDPELSRHERHILEHEELGKSVYDLHSDGSGVAYSSRLRPVLNLRPYRHNWLNGYVRHLSADLYILDWLGRIGIEHDVATDEDLHHEGSALLERHRVVVTGSHPEYWTRPMQQALHHYLEHGGRLMYLGGNGFYWVTSVFADRPHLIEVRRGNNGSRSWDSPPGESVHSATAHPGGLWAFNGYPPHASVGVGMAAQGWGPASAYRRLPDSHDERAAFVFDGIGSDELIGGFGHVLGGAAGDEVDRYAPELGTPDGTLRLATSVALDDHYQLTQEELLVTAPGQGGTENERVRADMTLREISGGGAVFSVGSICWAGSLAWNGYVNNVARISENVLRRFSR
ncbi:N,N-dimethylformamidase beta subunit family domain-containing protein [Sciscionella sediminilitoris]|uniref:N,N-dimethylformamidase beta subunit family domain-containing protein n=1 Tax=Sciscionella sediminilitoris TaxID=1445613 RepID=UPI00068E0903|nr:N,N-dimethylformamidase beta subunit family domain-containing protein [Sciscionella sp. SE31]